MVTQVPEAKPESQGPCILAPGQRSLSFWSLCPVPVGTSPNPSLGEGWDGLNLFTLKLQTPAEPSGALSFILSMYCLEQRVCIKCLCGLCSSKEPNWDLTLQCHV